MRFITLNIDGATNYFNIDQIVKVIDRGESITFVLTDGGGYTVQGEDARKVRTVLSGLSK